MSAPTLERPVEKPTLVLSLLDLLERHGFDRSLKAKLVRHQSARYDVNKLRREGWFEHYQGFQRNPVYGDASQIVSFVGAGGTFARFVGVYELKRHRAARSVRLPRGFPYREWRFDAELFYDLVPLPEFEPLRDRIVIDWGKGTRSWVQTLKDKEIVELLPDGRIRDEFTDYQEFVLSYEALAALSRSPEANKEWRARLTAVAGIYLVTATTTGDQYVGSAHGAEGIWGRWNQYAKNGHGGNARLKELVQADARYPTAFNYSVLHVLPASTTRAEVLRWEGIYKEKLGTRATGLNLN